MKRILSSGWFVVVLGVGLACSSSKYYMVKDPSTGKVYYTDKVKKEDGSTTLTDAKTKATVTIQNSEVTEISEQSYEQGVAAPLLHRPSPPPPPLRRPLRLRQRPPRRPQRSPRSSATRHKPLDGPLRATVPTALCRWCPPADAVGLAA